MPKPFSINILVPKGELKEWFKINQPLLWPGEINVFSRNAWRNKENKINLHGVGVYILEKYSDSNDTLPLIYIGQTTRLKKRISIHHYNKGRFWDRVICFTTSDNQLNTAHSAWLEWALIIRAKEVQSYKLGNEQIPKETILSPSEKANISIYLEKVYEILPLVGLRAFEEPNHQQKINEKSTSHTAKTSKTKEKKINQEIKDTIVVSSYKDGIHNVFLGKNVWHAIRIAKSRIEHLRWLAIYETAPVSAVTYIAEIESIVPFEDTGKLKVIFKRNSTIKLENQIKPKEMKNALQGKMYTTKSKIDNATHIEDLKVVI